MKVNLFASNNMKSLMRIITNVVILINFGIVGVQQIQAENHNEIVNLDFPDAVQVIWNHDFSKIAALTGEKIIVWETENWEQIYEIPNAYSYAIAWHPNENQLAGLHGGRNESITIWNGETGDILNQFNQEVPNTIAGVVVLHALSWSPDGRYIATDSVINTITIWDIQLGIIHSTIPQTETSFHNIVELLWSPDSTYLLSGSVNGSIRVWNVQSSINILDVEGYSYVAWNADATLFAGMSLENSVTIWNLENEEIVAEINLHTNTITSIDWNTNNDILVSTDADGNMLIWDFTNNIQLNSNLLNSLYIRNANWRKDGLQLAVIHENGISIIQWN